MRSNLIKNIIDSVLLWINHIRQKILNSGIQQGPSTNQQKSSNLTIAIKFLPEVALVVLLAFSLLQKDLNNISQYEAIKKFSENKTTLNEIPKKPAPINFIESNGKVSKEEINTNDNTNTVEALTIELEQASILRLENRSPDDIQKAILAKIKTYTVKPTDTLTSIAKEHGISEKTLIWTNQLENKPLTPNSEIKIMPTDGFLVRFGESSSLRDIASKYNGNLKEIMAYNGFASESDPDAGSLIICPNCTIPQEKQTPVIQTARQQKNNQTPKEYSKLAVLDDELFDGSGTSHAFEPGNCTWFVAKYFPVTFGGHAKYWLSNAKKSGYETGEFPEVGAAVALDGNTRYGHIALVVDTTSSQIKIREMNYRKLYQITERWIDHDDKRIKGYIYRPNKADFNSSLEE